MAQIGNVPGIIEVKSKLSQLQHSGLVEAWALPYENILTRLDAAIFFLRPAQEPALAEIWSALGGTPGLQYQKNEDEKLSDLPWQFQFAVAARA